MRPRSPCRPVAGIRSPSSRSRARIAMRSYKSLPDSAFGKRKTEHGKPKTPNLPLITSSYSRITMRPGLSRSSTSHRFRKRISMTHRGALIASLALTIAVALVLGSQWSSIASRSSPADPTPAPTSPAEPFNDPGMVSTEADGSGMAAQTGFSLDAIQTTPDPADRRMPQASGRREAGTRERRSRGPRQ